MIDVVAKMEQPACQAGFDQMQCIAGGGDLKLHQQHPEVNLDRVPDRGALGESGVKSQCRDARGGARRARNCCRCNGRR